MKDRIVSVERTRNIQVFGAFTSEINVLRDQATVAEGEDASAIRTAMLASMDAELDAWAVRIRAKAKADAEAAQRPGPMETKTAADSAVAAATKPKPDMHGQPVVISHETRKALMEAKASLEAVTKESVEFAVPKTESDAQLILKSMQESLRLLAAPRTATAPARAMGTDPGNEARAELGPPGPKPATCSNSRAHRGPTGIPPEVAAYSVKHFGKPLCRDCQDEERRRNK